MEFKQGHPVNVSADVHSPPALALIEVRSATLRHRPPELMARLAQGEARTVLLDVYRLA